MGEAEDAFPFRVETVESLFIPLSDGTRLAARLWLPEGAGRTPVPVILEYLPYRKRDGTRWRDRQTHHWLAGHGYGSIRVDIRGTGDSDGVITDEYTSQEWADGLEVIDWIARQSFCNGQVAMIGISWGGFNGLQIAALKPEALKAVISVGSTDDRYATDVHYIGGCLSKDNVDWSATMFAYNDLPPDPAIVGERWRAMWMERLEANRPWIIPWLHHQRRDDYWKHGSVCEDFAAIDIPVFAVSGWADNYSEAVPRLLAGLKGPRHGLIGPWAHHYPHNGTVGPLIDWLGEIVRFLDHYLKGVDNGFDREPMLKVWMQESFAPKTCHEHFEGRWVAENVWPSPNIVPTRYPLGSDGRLGNAALRGTCRLCSPLSVGNAAGEVGRYGGEADWAGDQREDDAGSLVFESEVLSERVEILGAPKLAIRFSVDCPMALVAVRLNDVFPDGRSARVSVGLLNLCHVNGHETPERLEPGRIHEGIVELDDIAHAFPPGHRIAVSLSTTYWPIAWPSPELVTLDLDCAGSVLTLPVRPPRAGDAALRPFGPPVLAAPDPREDSPSGHRIRRRVTRDLLSGTISVDFPRGNLVRVMPDIGQTHVSEGHARYVVTEGDPLSALTETWQMAEIRRSDTVIRHESTHVLSADATHFHLDVTLKVSENGVQVFDRSFSERIARDHV